MGPRAADALIAAYERGPADLHSRAQALGGLAVVGGPRARAYLRAVAADDRSPDARVAARALDGMAPR
jgi:hypothetical protein